MGHSIFGWDLPPGVTQRHIDDAFGGDEADCYCIDLRRHRERVLRAAGFSRTDAHGMADAEEARGDLRCEHCAYVATQEYTRDQDDD